MKLSNKESVKKNVVTGTEALHYLALKHYGQIKYEVHEMRCIAPFCDSGKAELRKAFHVNVFP